MDERDYYTTEQLDMMRLLLQEWRSKRRKKGGEPAPWSRLVDDIDKYTDLYARWLSFRKDTDSDEPFDGPEYDSPIYRNRRSVIERVRKFVEGETKNTVGRPAPSFIISGSIWDYLSNSEASGIPYSRLKGLEKGVVPAAHFAEFLWGRSPGHGETVKVPTGTFASLKRVGGSTTFRVVILHATSHPFCCQVREDRWDETGEKMLEQWTGWLSVDRYGDLHIVLKLIGNGDTLHYKGALKYLSVQSILLEFGVIQKLDTDDAQSRADVFIKRNMPADESFYESIVKDASLEHLDRFVLFAEFEDFFDAKSRLCQGVNGDERRRIWGRSRFLSRKSVRSLSMESLTDRFEGKPALIRAILEANYDAFCALIEQGQDINVLEPETGLRPIHYIAMLGRRDEFEVVKELEGVEYVARDNEGRLPTFYATQASVDNEMVAELHELQHQQGAERGYFPGVFGDEPLRKPDPLPD